MYRPPAVSHTVGRSSWVLGVVTVLAGVALFSAVLLAHSNAVSVFRWGTVPVLVCCTALAFNGWYGSASGKLQWDGEHWMWSGFADTPLRRAQSILDFQGLVLLKVTSEMGDVVWLWLQGHMDDSHWLAVRRAVVFSQALGVRQGPHLHEAGAGPFP